jgi:adenosylmethionine-8-amino-7-oxononanoate aminotransferase
MRFSLQNKTIDLLNYDKEHIWHPYTSMLSPLKCYLAKRAEGVEIYLEDGRVLIDGMSSWWAAIHGYNNKYINDAAKTQLENMSHIMFGGFTHEPAINLTEKLLSILPNELNKVFYSDSGSVAVEVAMKMALQYFFVKGEHKRTKFLTVKNGYHGDTFHAMSVCDPVTGMHEIYRDVLPQNIFAEAPQCKFHQEWDDKYIADFNSKLENYSSEICAVILEPIVQGAGGMRFYSPTYINKVRELCNKHNVLLIFDEIATGFGRTGKNFAFEHTEVLPDILCLGKAITGGYISFAATVTNDNIAAVLSTASPGVFMHGPTFMGNPLACAIATANLELYLQSNYLAKIKSIEELLLSNLSRCNTFDIVEEVRVLGAIGVVELKYPVDVERIQELFVDKGVWIRPFGKLIYIMPPYIIELEQLSIITDAIYDVLKNNSNDILQKNKGEL